MSSKLARFPSPALSPRESVATGPGPTMLTGESITVHPWAGRTCVFKLQNGQGFKGVIVGESAEFIQLENAILRKSVIVYVHLMEDNY